ncbi:MAG: response regulator [Thermodesulfobacteriota bacterium]|nr:response regulator [Thermodesulfobacteriota bacterium]
MKEGQTILLVDYNESVIDTVRKLANQSGLKLLLAEDGQEGLDLAKAELPDLIIIRKDVPILDALSMSVLLKQSPETDDIPVVLICMVASSSERERLHDAGCSGFIEEPFTENDLLQRLEDWLP